MKMTDISDIIGKFEQGGVIWTAFSAAWNAIRGGYPGYNDSQMTTRHETGIGGIPKGTTSTELLNFIPSCSRCRSGSLSSGWNVYCYQDETDGQFKAD
ncbi:hypothetical protein QCA50_020631 [Cerrena zonata]|uniref:Uncharacterized protein n=1 Tax=Cerrena zonata TaxID=2478898 RepID=A0AAW0FFU0_9APHY